MQIAKLGINNTINSFKGNSIQARKTDSSDVKLIDQHISGAFGVDFNDCSKEEILEVTEKLKKRGVDGIFPTLSANSSSKIKKQIKIIKDAAKEQTPNQAKIYGIHLDSVFAGSHEFEDKGKKVYIKPTVENYKKIEDDFIKIVTLAPERDKNNELANYLLSKGVKVQAGHCKSGDLSSCTGVSDLLGSTAPIGSKNSTSLSALTNDDIYTEIVADGKRVSDEALRLILNIKPSDKIILASNSKVNPASEFDSPDEKEDNVLLSDVVQHLKDIGLYNPQFIANTYTYHNIEEETPTKTFNA